MQKNRLNSTAEHHRAKAADPASVEKREIRRRWLIVSPAMIIIGVIGILPLSIILIYSFLKPGAYAGVEWSFTFDAWINLVLERDLFDDTLGLNIAHLLVFGRSIGLAFCATLLTLLFGFPTAYFIATRPAQRRNLWLFLISLPFWSNMLVRTFSMMLFIRERGFINELLIRIGLIETPFQILYTNTAIGIGLVYGFLPLMVMPLYASMEKLDFSIVEASYDLYASRWKVLLRVIIPLVKPGIVSGCILVFIPSLGAYVTPKILGGGKTMMLGGLIANQFTTSRNWPLGSALALFLMALVMIALMFYVRNAARSQVNDS